MKKKLAGCIVGGLIGGMLLGAVTNNEEVKYIDGSVGGINWTLNSGEAAALKYQAYESAINTLEEKMANYTGDQKPAIVLDVDETVLNNHSNSINDFVTRQGYDKDRFTEFALKEEALIVEGADKFLKRAEELGVEVFYITNRYEQDLQATINNLAKYGLPNADKDHVLINTATSNKLDRVNSVRVDHDVILFVGDNLSDFPDDFHKGSNKERFDKVNEINEKFGTDYIVIPNAIYGDWDNATFDYKFDKSDEDKIKDRLDLIENFGVKGEK